MKEIIFTKLTGAGNDFILIDSELNSDISISPSLIKKLCDRRFGIGADGLLVISDDLETDFQMKYFNSDGTSGMLCGNGARCIIKYAEHTGRIKDSQTKFVFQSERFSGNVIDKNTIKFDLNPPSQIKENIVVNILGKSFNAAFIDNGAHHVIIDLAKQSFDSEDLQDIEQFPVEKYGRAIRYSDQFAPLGTNVNFIQHEKEIIKIRTYERGVEQETLACGTGAVASALTSVLSGEGSAPITLRTKSNELLMVDFNVSPTNEIENVSLTGPAKIVFKGKIKI
ncbi:MAG: diaminopimelate epimerase [Bacteroidota bacterium]